ncbi:MAG: serine/threonine-protein kinase [Anaerolineae bacterium]
MIDIFNGQFDRYEIRERIGSGGMARVYKAWDTNLERLVAIKVLHEHLADDPTFKERFEREAKFIASFNHPNIVQLYDYAVKSRDGFPLCYMVMSYIPGSTLRGVMEDAAQHGERLPRERIRQLVDDLTSALGYAHRRGMVHRDVKPGNIILDEHSRAILTDFGIARMVQSTRLTADGVSTGTPIYMSPEQASGQPGDSRSDLYSLGIIVYEMLTTRPPFVDDTSLSVMLKHLNTPHPAPSEFIQTRQYDAFMSKALAKKPDERFQSAEDFARAFHAAQDSAEIDTVQVAQVQTPAPVKPASSTTSVLQTLSHVARENPRASSAIFVAGIGALALLVLLLVNAGATRRPAAEPTAAPTTSRKHAARNTVLHKQLQR